MKLLINLALLIALATSCTKGTGECNEPSQGSARDITNISYGSDEKQKFDLYLPAGRSAEKTKVFLFIHGGGWTGGDKFDFYTSIPVLKSAYFPDYAIVNMNYILGDVAKKRYALPDQLNDIQAVIDMIKTKSAEYQVKPEFVLCGHSAGAHLAMFYAYTKKNPDVKAVISLAGPADFEDPVYTNNILGIFFGNLVNPSVIPSGMNFYKYASPVTWIGSGSTPTIAFFGSTDTAVPVKEQKAHLENKLAQYSVPHETHIWNGDHNA